LGRKKKHSKSTDKQKTQISPMRKILKKIKTSKNPNLNLTENNSIYNYNNKDRNNNNNFPKANMNMTPSAHQRFMPNISLFGKNCREEFSIFNQNLPAFPVLNHPFSYESFNNLSEENKKQHQNQQQQNKFFQMPDNNAKYILNTNLNMQKILNYNINNINNINNDIRGSKEIKKLLSEKKKLKIKKIESRSVFSSLDNTENNYTNLLDCGFSSHNFNIKKFTSCKSTSKNEVFRNKQQIIGNKNFQKEAKRNLIMISNKSKNIYEASNFINRDSKCALSEFGKNSNSDLSLDEDENEKSRLRKSKVASAENNKILEELKNQEESARVALLRKACDGLLFYKINLSGASNAKVLLGNINQINKILDEIKNQNTFEVIIIKHKFS
jgi:hypothetical protein